MLAPIPNFDGIRTHADQIEQTASSASAVASSANFAQKGNGCAAICESSSATGFSSSAAEIHVLDRERSPVQAVARAQGRQRSQRLTESPREGSHARGKRSVHRRAGPRLFPELLPHRSGPRSRSVGRGGADRPTEPPTELLAVTGARICNGCNDSPLHMRLKSSRSPISPAPWPAGGMQLMRWRQGAPQAIFERTMA